MTILDKNTQLSDSQALTVTADSTNVLDFTSDRDIGPGEPMAIIVFFETAIGGTTPTFQVTVETDDNAAHTSATVITESEILVAAPADDQLVVPIPFTNERFMQLRYVLGGTSPTVTVSAYLMPQSSAEAQRYLPNNYDITSVA